jgi:hypothetical protein
VAQQARKARAAGRKWIEFGVVSAMLFAGIVVLVWQLGDYFRDQSRIGERADSARLVVDACFRALDARDSERALRLLADSEDPTVPRRELEAMLSEQNYPVIAGYRGLVVDTLTTHYTFWSNARVYLRGRTSYQDGTVGNFTAALVWEANAWRVMRINVVAPPEKLERWKTAHEAVAADPVQSEP